MCCGHAHLGVELDEGGAQAHEAREQGLVQVAVALEGHVLHHRGQLVVVPDQRDPLEPAAPVLGFLRGQADVSACSGSRSWMRAASGRAKAFCVARLTSEPVWLLSA